MQTIWQRVFHLEGDLERIGPLKMNWYRRRRIRSAGWGALLGIIVALIVIGIIIFWVGSQRGAREQGSRGETGQGDKETRG